MQGIQFTPQRFLHDLRDKSTTAAGYLAAIPPQLAHRKLHLPAMEPTSPRRQGMTEKAWPIFVMIEDTLFNVSDIVCVHKEFDDNVIKLRNGIKFTLFEADAYDVEKAINEAVRDSITDIAVNTAEAAKKMAEKLT